MPGPGGFGRRDLGKGRGGGRLFGLPRPLPDCWARLLFPLGALFRALGGGAAVRDRFDLALETSHKHIMQY